MHHRHPPGRAGVTGPKPPNLPDPAPPDGGRPTTEDKPARGMGFAVLGSLLLTSNDSVAKLLTEQWPVGQIMGLRGTVILCALLIILRLRGRMHVLRIQNKRAMAIRAAAITGATFGFLTALSLMPIADAVALVFISPILATGLAIVVLKERVGWRRWAAMALGLVGVFVALNPGGTLGAPQSYPWQVALIPLGTALLVAVRDVSSRWLVSGDDSLAIMFYTVLAVALSGYATAPFTEWGVPGTAEIALIGLSACFMFGAYYFQIESFRFAPVNLIGPFRYFSLIFAAAIGFALWGDVPSWNMILGAAIIVASGLFIWWRERGTEAA
jgi:drug/metabolite transporter (DMT)-like permease